jgi:hypothetical protein
MIYREFHDELSPEGTFPEAKRTLNEMNQTFSKWETVTKKEFMVYLQKYPATKFIIAINNTTPRRRRVHKPEYLRAPK